MRTSIGIRGALVFSLSVLASGCFFHFPEYTWERDELRLEIGADLAGTYSIVKVGVSSTEYPKSVADNRHATEQLCAGGVSYGFDSMAIDQWKTHLAAGDSMEPHTTIREDGRCDHEIVLKFKDLERLDLALFPFDLTRVADRLAVESRAPSAPAKTESADEPPKDERPQSMVVHYTGRILEHNATQEDAQTGRLTWDFKSELRPRFVLDAPR